MASCDIAIIGGGVMGCSTAYHLLQADPTLDIMVVEKDPTYSQASSALSVGNARIQFSLRENIQVSQHLFETLETFGEAMEIDGLQPDVGWRREGNLFLADEKAESALRKGLELQRQMGCEVEWWSATDIEERLPLYAAEGLVGGTFGPQDGYLDGYSFLMAYRHKAADLGASFVHGEASRVCQAAKRVSGIDLRQGERVNCGVVVNCAGAWAAEVCRTLGIDLPVEPVQRQVFVAEPAVKPAAPLPLTSLPSGLYFRSEGAEHILVGKSLADDRVGFDLRWQESRFTDLLWPELVTLVPVFDRLRIERGWTGLYAVNSLDGNAILGEWPEVAGLYLACGFSGHGLQQAPAVGRYVAELILTMEPLLDLSVFGAARILENRPVVEIALV